MIYTIFYGTILSCFQKAVYVFEYLFCPWQRREICYYDSPNNVLCYYRTSNVDIIIIGL
jgi:hypothetical protein